MAPEGRDKPSQLNDAQSHFIENLPIAIKPGWFAKIRALSVDRVSLSAVG